MMKNTTMISKLQSFKRKRTTCEPNVNKAAAAQPAFLSAGMFTKHPKRFLLTELVETLTQHLLDLLIINRLLQVGAHCISEYDKSLLKAYLDGG